MFLIAASTSSALTLRCALSAALSSRRSSIIRSRSSFSISDFAAAICAGFCAPARMRNRNGCSRRWSSVSRMGRSPTTATTRSTIDRAGSLRATEAPPRPRRRPTAAYASSPLSRFPRVLQATHGQILYHATERPHSAGKQADQRFEYWKRLRAPGWPYFLRSFFRASRVRKPARFSDGALLGVERDEGARDAVAHRLGLGAVPPPVHRRPHVELIERLDELERLAHAPCATSRARSSRRTACR